MVETLAALERYRWCGHSVIMNRCPNDWQDRRYVLGWFGEKEHHAKKLYREFVDKGVALGNRPELTGGGLIRSMGGWSMVKAMRNRGLNEQGDARILGSGEFVSAVINHADEKIKHQLPVQEWQTSIKGVVEKHCRREKVAISMLQSGSRRPPLPKLRKAIALILVNDYGVSLAETARQVGISTSGVAQIIKRNEA